MRRAGIIAVIAISWPAFATTPAAAHGIGGALELPMPLSFFAAGAALLLMFAFSALVVAWPEARWQSESAGRVLATGWRRLVFVLEGVGVAGLALVVAAGLFGDTRRTNAAPTLVLVYFWLAVPALSALVGDLWRHLNPWRTLAGDRERSAFPVPAADVGLYPAAIAYAVFMWLVLVPDFGTEPRVLAMGAIAYSGYIAAAVFISDRERAFGSFDAFTPYNYLIGAIAPLELDAHGTWRWHGWLRRLAAVPAHKGLTLFVAAVIGAILYDGLSASDLWVELWGTTRFAEWFGTAALLSTIGAVWLGYRGATWFAARMAGTSTPAQVAASFAHALVPIGLAYAVTHYFTAIVFEGQLLVSIISDPLGLGSDYFGTALREVTLWIDAGVIWYVQLGVIVAGHLAAALLVHDRALAVFPNAHAVRSQYPLLALVALFASIGLVLLSVA